MKILVTGSSGMLGRDICKVFSADHRVIGIDISGDEVSYKADISDLDAVKEVFAKEKPDIVIHSAAYTDVDGCERDPDKAYRINTEGTCNIVEACSDIGASLIFISTDFVFNGGKDSPYKEDEETGAINVYGKSKLKAEEALGEFSRDYAIVRTSWLYGAHGKNFVDTIIKKAKEDKVLKVVDDQVGSPTYTKDLALALKDLIESGDILGREIYHVSNTKYCSWYAFTRKIIDLEGGMEEVLVEPIASSELARAAERPKYSVLDTGKFEERIGRKMRSWEEALGEFISER